MPPPLCKYAILSGRYVKIITQFWLWSLFPCFSSFILDFTFSLFLVFLVMELLEKIGDWDPLVVSLVPCVTNRSSYLRCSVTKTVLKNFAKFTGKHLCWSLLLIKLYMYMCVSGGKKCLFFGKSGVLYFLVTPFWDFPFSHIAENLLRRH